MDSGAILLVDDDPDIREFLGLYLETSGHAVTVASDGNEALDSLEVSAPEVIIADVKMPRMTGYDLCRRVRESGREEIPFIFCSALGTLTERMKGLRLGADDYVVKPVNPEELLLKVELALARSRRVKQLESELFRRSSKLLLEGRLGKVSVADVLQLCSWVRESDVRLEVLDADGRWGSVYLRAEQVLHAEVEGATGLRAFNVILGWSRGAFRLDSASFDREPTIDRSLDACLLEGMARIDEYRHVQDRIAPGEGLRVRPAADVFTRHYEPPTAEVLSLIARFGALDQVVEEATLSEAETLRIVSELLDSGVVEPLPRIDGQGGIRGNAA